MLSKELLTYIEKNLQVEDKQNIPRYLKIIEDFLETIRSDIDTQNYIKTHKNDWSSNSVQFYLQAKRVLHILDVCVKKIEMALCLPLILNDQIVIEERKDDLNFQEMIRIWEEIQMEFLNSHDYDQEVMTVQSLVISCINLAIQSQFLDYVPSYLEQLSPISHQFIYLLREMSKLADWTISLRAPSTLIKEKAINRMRLENIKLTEKIQNIAEQLSDENEKFQAMLKENSKIVEAYEQEIQSIKQKHHDDMEILVDNSEKRILKVFKNSEERQEQLFASLNECHTEYDEMVKSTKIAERTLINQKIEVQSELIGWINKYDTEVGGLTEKMNEMENRLSDEKAKFQQFTEQFQIQKIQYDRMDAEIEANELRIRTEKLMLFMMNRAAKVIQRAWKYFMSRKRKRRGKGRKGKK